MCPRTLVLGQCVPWMMSPLDDRSTYDPSFTEGGVQVISNKIGLYRRGQRPGILDAVPMQVQLSEAWVSPSGLSAPAETQVSAGAL
jgi:hypothetical protein